MSSSLLPTNFKNIKGIRVLDALAASGLRSLRYHKELSRNLVDSITINDLDPAAVDLAKENIEFNNLSQALLDCHHDNGNDDTGNDNDNDKIGKTDDDKPKIYIHNEDATHLMYMSRRKPNKFSSAPTTTSPTSKLPLFDQYDVIDLDPYGSAAPFLDSALQAISNGGMLAITCTDMKALGGSQTDTCYARYGSMPINKAKYLQELALRILLSDIAKRAATYGRNIKPILSVGMNFYVRVFIEVYSHGPSVKTLSSNIGTVYQSVQCPSFHIVPNGQVSANNVHVIQSTRAPKVEKCSETGSDFKTAGPIWLGPLHDNDVMQEAIGRLDTWIKEKGGSKKSKMSTQVSNADMNVDTAVVHDKSTQMEFGHVKMGKELHGLLTSVSEELNDTPLYYVLPHLCHTLGCTCPPLKAFKAAIINAGYRVSGYHKEPNAIKTNAPNKVVWDILRVWCKEHPPKKNSKKRENKRKKRRKNESGDISSNNQDQSSNVTEISGEKPTPMSAGEKILSVEPSIKVDFSIPDELKSSKRVCRFPMNPQANWGPKKAASGYKRKSEDDIE